MFECAKYVVDLLYTPIGETREKVIELKQNGIDINPYTPAQIGTCVAEIAGVFYASYTFVYPIIENMIHHPNTIGLKGNVTSAHDNVGVINSAAPRNEIATHYLRGDLAQESSEHLAGEALNNDHSI